MYLYLRFSGISYNMDTNLSAVGLFHENKGVMNTFSELEIIVLLHYITCIFAKEINNYDWRRQSLCSFLVQASNQIFSILYFCWKVCGCWNGDRLFNIVKRHVSAELFLLLSYTDGPTGCQFNEGQIIIIDHINYNIL